jgi:hypothetical protein
LFKASNDERFAEASKHYFTSNNKIDEDHGETSGDDWSDDSLSETDEVNDDIFEQYIPIIRYVGKTECVIADDQLRTEDTNEDRTEDDDDTIGSGVKEIDIPVGEANKKKQYTIAEAWLRKEVHSELRKSKARSKEQYVFVHSVLYCNTCCDHGVVSVSIGDDKYFAACLRDKWFDTEFIIGFTSLLAHDAHLTPPKYSLHSDRVKMIQCPYPKAEIRPRNVITLPSIITHLLLIAHSSDHFAVVRFDLHLRQVFVFDGLNYKIDNWKDHVIHTLRQYALVPLDIQPKCKLTSNSTTSTIGVCVKQLMEIKFGSEAPWKMTNQHFTRQRDGHNCGPIACLKVMEVFGYIDKGQVEVIAKSPSGYRNIVMNQFADLVSKYDNVLFVEMRSKGDDLGNIEVATSVPTERNIMEAIEEASNEVTEIETEQQEEVMKEDAEAEAAMEMKQDDVTEEATTEEQKEAMAMEDDVAATVEEENEAMTENVTEEASEGEDEITQDNICTFLGVNNTSKEEYTANIEDLKRKVAMQKKKKMQEVNAEKAIKQRGDHLVAKGLGTGAVLSLSVDYRTHSHASGLLAIVYRSNVTGAALVCCEHGVITHDGSKKDYWVPSDKFVVIASEHEDCALTSELQELRDDIKRGNYDYTAQPRISYRKYHAQVIGASSPPKRRTCTCKGGCSKRCGCRQKNVECNSSC